LLRRSADRVVTFLFTDLEASTRLSWRACWGPRIGPCCAHRRVLLRALTTYGGVPMFTEGDSLFVGSPTLGRLAACPRGQLALAAHEWPAPHRPAAGPDCPAHRLRQSGRRRVPRPGGARAARISAAAHGGQDPLLGATLKARDRHRHDIRLSTSACTAAGFANRERLYQLFSPRPVTPLPAPRNVWPPRCTTCPARSPRSSVAGGSPVLAGCSRAPAGQTSSDRRGRQDPAGHRDRGRPHRGTYPDACGSPTLSVRSNRSRG